MFINDKELKKQLKAKSFQRVYLIYGDEKRLVKNAVTDLETALGITDREAIGYHSLSYTAAVPDIAAAVDAVPFLSEKNVVRLNDIDVDAMSKEDFESFVSLIGNTPDTTVFIIAMPTLSYTPKKSKAKNPKPDRMQTVINAVDQNGAVLEEKSYTENSAVDVLVRKAHQNGCRMNPAVAHRVISRLGGEMNLNALSNEMEKLIAYANGGEITVEMVEALVPKSEEESVYSLFSAVAGGNADRALRILESLYYQKMDPVAVCTVLSYSYTDAYILRTARERGENDRALAALKLRTPQWKYNEIRSVTRGVTTPALRRSIEELTETSQLLITASVNAKQEVEKLLAKLVLLSRDKSDE